MGSAPKRTASKVGAEPARPAVRIARPYAEVILEYLSRQRCWRDRARAAPAREVFQNRSCAINARPEQNCAPLCDSTGSTVGHPRVTIFYHQTHGKPTSPLHSGRLMGHHHRSDIRRRWLDHPVGHPVPDLSQFYHSFPRFVLSHRGIKRYGCRSGHLTGNFRDGRQVEPFGASLRLALGRGGCSCRCAEPRAGERPKRTRACHRRCRKLQPGSSGRGWHRELVRRSDRTWQEHRQR